MHSNPFFKDPPALADDRIDLRTVSLDIDSRTLEEARKILSPDERKRADRFRFPRHARRFTAARAFLRRTLGAYLGIEPAALTFEYGSEGKPSLPYAIAFNQSDSEELAVVAVTRSREVGVDIEKLRPIENAELLAGRFFSAAETRELMAIPAAERERAFLACWTRKESYLKATGEGLTRPLAEFQVVVDPRLNPCLVNVDFDHDEEQRWSMVHIDPAPGFIGALTIEGTAEVCWPEPTPPSNVASDR